MYSYSNNASWFLKVSSILPDNVEEKEVFWYYKQSQDDTADEEITTALWEYLNACRLGKWKKSGTIDKECDDSSKKIPKGSTNEWSINYFI